MGKGGDTLVSMILTNYLFQEVMTYFVTDMRSSARKSQLESEIGLGKNLSNRKDWYCMIDGREFVSVQSDAENQQPVL